MNLNHDDPETKRHQSEKATSKLYDKSSTAELQSLCTATSPQPSEHWNDTIHVRKDSDSTSLVCDIKSRSKAIIDGAHSGSMNEDSARSSEIADTSVYVKEEKDTPASSEGGSSIFSELVSPSKGQKILADNSSSIEINNEISDGKSSGRKSSTDYFVNDPNKVSVKFLFANRDGIHVLIKFNTEDTVRDMKGALIQAWPDSKFNPNGLKNCLLKVSNVSFLPFIRSDIPPCCDIDAIRLIFMGRGVLTPDSRTLKECGVPTFETHATPVNVSVRPCAGGQMVDGWIDRTEKKRPCVRNSSDAFPSSGSRGHNGDTIISGLNHSTSSQGCACVLL
jgi:hypothetical protein